MPHKTPTEVLTAALRGCVDAYPGAPALAAKLVAALRAADYIIVRSDAIRLAQAHAREEVRDGTKQGYAAAGGPVTVF